MEMHGGPFVSDRPYISASTSTGNIGRERD